MTLQFDTRGLLKPYRRTKISLLEFEELFVKSFEGSESRKGIFESYKSYVDAFSREITPSFSQWLDGSFLTEKKNPRDLDFVTLLDTSIAKEKEELLLKRFLKNGALDWFGIDAYLVEVFPNGHPKASFTKSDLAYWNDWFSKTRENRNKKSFPKGYVEIKF